MLPQFLTNQLPHLLGSFVLFQTVFELSKWVYVCFIRPAKNLKELGDWAVVTGATDGIGKAIAIELASKQKLKILLISRSEDKLKAAKEEVEKAFGSDAEKAVETVALDMSSLGQDAKARERVKAALVGKKLAVLVNNVGVSYEHPDYFDALTDSRVDELVSLNIIATTIMTRLVLPQMKEQKSGKIVSIASSSAVFDNCPLLAQYAAAKDYVRKLSKSLNAEYKEYNVGFQSQPAHFVTSKLSKIRSPGLTTATPKSFAQASVKAMGWGEAEISPFWSHYLLDRVFKSLPGFVCEPMMMIVHKGIRAKALKKKNKEL